MKHNWVLKQIGQGFFFGYFCENCSIRGMRFDGRIIPRSSVHGGKYHQYDSYQPDDNECELEIARRILTS